MKSLLLIFSPKLQQTIKIFFSTEHPTAGLASFSDDSYHVTIKFDLSMSVQIHELTNIHSQIFFVKSHPS
jgi:hypothetical protein